MIAHSTPPTDQDTPAAARGWFRVPVAVVAKLPSLGHLAVSVYLVLCDRADEAGVSWPAVDTIAEQIGAKRRAVQYALVELRDAGLIEIREATNDTGRRTSNRYIVLDASTNVRDASTCTDASGCTGTMHQDAPPRVHVDARGRVHVDAQEQEPVLNKNQMNKSQVNNHAARGKTTARFTVEDFDSLNWPASLDTVVGREALETWLRYKHDRREDYKGTSGLQALLNEFEKHTDGVFAESVQRAMSSNWAGCFPPKQGTNGHTQTSMFGRNAAAVQGACDYFAAKEGRS